MVKRYEQFVSDHQKYDRSYTTTSEWMDDLEQRYEMCKNIATDQSTLEKKLTKIQVNALYIVIIYINIPLRSVSKPIRVIGICLLSKHHIFNCVMLYTTAIAFLY